MPLLAVFEKVSEFMSAEKTPTMCGRPLFTFGNNGDEKKDRQ